MRDNIAKNRAARESGMGTASRQARAIGVEDAKACCAPRGGSVGGTARGARYADGAHNGRSPQDKWNLRDKTETSFRLLASV